MDTQEVLLWLDDSAKDRFVKLEETFGTDGWKILSEWAQIKSLEALGEAGNAASWDDCLKAQERKKLYEAVSNWEEGFLNEFALVAEQAREQADLESEGFEE